MKHIYFLVISLLLGALSPSGGLLALPSTAAPNVYVLDSAFQMPQLNRSRRIWIYLPPDYDTTSKRYPVLYMQDAQNLFDDSLAFGGTEWQVDEALNFLFAGGDRGCIVVGIESSVQRADEYSPWVYSGSGSGGEGDEYMQFIVSTLKPYVDATYRTLTDRVHTGIAGSSLGGLITMYGAINYQQVFAKVAAMSPSVYYSEGALVQLVGQQGRQGAMRIWLEAGTSESSGMLTDLDLLYDALVSAGFTAGSELTKVIEPGGMHNEATWGSVFPAAYQWLMMNEGNVSSVDDVKRQAELSLSPNPADRMLHVSCSEPLKPGVSLQLVNLSGQVVKTVMMNASESLFGADVSELPCGLYFARLVTNEGSGGGGVLVKKVVVER